MFETQTPLWQSAAPPHTPPAEHLGHVPPPQSTSVSLAFLTKSVQVAALQVEGAPVHTPLWQSPAPAHSLPVPHFGQSEPQSTSVSV